MFSSLLFYQIVGALCGLALVAALRRFLPGSLRRWFTSRFASTPFRQLWLLEFPAFVVVAAALLCLFALFRQPRVDALLGRLYVDGILTSFLTVGAVWYAGALWFPLLGVLLAFRRPALPDRLAAGALFLAALGLMAVAMVLEPHRIEVTRTRIELEGWPAGVPPLRVAVLADIQSPRYGRREAEVVRIVQAEQPDLVLVPGDVIDKSLDDRLPLEGARELFGQLSPRLGIYAVSGDVDEHVPGGLPVVLAGTRVRLLENEGVELLPGIFLSGFDPVESWSFEHHLNQKREPGAVHLALVHQPQYTAAFARHGFDLVVAGHTHGGQVVLPFFGPLITLSPLPRSIDAGGLHEIAGAQLYLSRGIGVEGGFAPPLRFLCRPEVAVLELGPRGDPSP